MSRYLPMCDYIDHKLEWLPRGSGIGISLACVLGANYNLHSIFQVAANETWAMSGFAGFLLAGGIVEKRLPGILNDAGIGLKKGGVILRSAQVTAVSLPMAFSIGMQTAQMKDDEPSFLSDSHLNSQTLHPENN